MMSEIGALILSLRCNFRGSQECQQHLVNFSSPNGFSMYGVLP
jgi:hypothetical protein